VHNVLSLLKHFTSLASSRRLCDRHFQINRSDLMPSSHEINTWYNLKKMKFTTRVWVIFIIIGIQPLGRSGQRPEFSQATGMALVPCILGKFLGVACHCFPPLFFKCSHFSPPGASTSATT